jgi:hypothetical protein
VELLDIVINGQMDVNVQLESGTNNFAMPRNIPTLMMHNLRFIFGRAFVTAILQSMIFIVKPSLVLSDKDEVEYSVKESVLLVLSLITISLGSCENFLTCDIWLGSLQIKIMDWRIAVTKAPPNHGDGE